MTSLQVFYPVILLYMVAAFLQGGTAVSMGLLNNVRTFLFIRVSQDAYRQVLLLHLVTLLDKHLATFSIQISQVIPTSRRDKGRFKGSGEEILEQLSIYCKTLFLYSV